MIFVQRSPWLAHSGVLKISHREWKMLPQPAPGNLAPTAAGTLQHTVVAPLSAMTKEVLKRTPTDFPCTWITDKDTMTFLGQRTAEESFAVMRVAFPCPTVYSLFQMIAVACKTQTRETIQISLWQWFLLCTISLLISYWWSSKVSVMQGGLCEQDLLLHNRKDSLTAPDALKECTTLPSDRASLLRYPLKWDLFSQKHIWTGTKQLSSETGSHFPVFLWIYSMISGTYSD